MHTTLPPMSESKKSELQIAIDLIKQTIQTECIILFGSYARGSQVEKDTYREGHITYEYQSDFDILVLVRSKILPENTKLLFDLEDKIGRHIKTPVGLIVENIDFTNERISEGRYFYKDIVEQGIVLYESDRCTLATPRTLTAQEKKAMAEEDFAYWFKKAEEFLIDQKNSFERGSFNNSAFYLHQAAESFFVTFLLVHTGYRPKSHDIKNLHLQASPFSSQMQHFFPLSTPQDRRLYDLLRRAYVDARYKKSYKITQEELEALMGHITHLKEVVHQACKNKIKAFVEEK